MTKKARPSQRSAAQAALSAKKAPPLTIPIVYLAYPRDLVLVELFASMVWLITLHQAGYPALRWVHWLLSHVWKDTFAPPTRLRPWVAANATQDITAPKARRIQFKRPRAPLPVTELLSAVFVSPAPFLHGQVKSIALPVQRGALALDMAPTCLGYVVLAPTDPKQTQYSASLVQRERIHLLAA